MDAVLLALLEEGNVEPWCDAVQATLEVLDGADFSHSAFSEASLKALFLHDIRLRYSASTYQYHLAVESECTIRGRYADLVLQTPRRVVLVEFKYAPFGFLQTTGERKRVFPPAPSAGAAPSSSAKRKSGGVIRRELNEALQTFKEGGAHTNCATIAHRNFQGRTETIAELRAAALEQARAYAAPFCTNNTRSVTIAAIVGYGSKIACISQDLRE
jgi:hypothetical protein